MCDGRVRAVCPGAPHHSLFGNQLLWDSRCGMVQGDGIEGVVVGCMSEPTWASTWSWSRSLSIPCLPRRRGLQTPPGTWTTMAVAAVAAVGSGAVTWVTTLGCKRLMKSGRPHRREGGHTCRDHHSSTSRFITWPAQARWKPSIHTARLIGERFFHHLPPNNTHLMQISLITLPRRVVWMVKCGEQIWDRPKIPQKGYR